jgi:GNAT superfamily N-acetyltransferase
VHPAPPVPRPQAPVIPVSPEFRTACDEDLVLLLTLMREYYAFDHLPYDETAARQALQALLHDPGLGRVWLIRVGAETAGYAVLALGYSLEYRGRDAFIDELYLRERYRGQGLGRQALQWLEQAARTLGVRALHLEVERGNPRAQALYRRHGFRDNDRQLLTLRLDG